jgi:hypothetical protein
MAVRDFTLKDAERRRQITIMVLAAGLVISTLPVTNERALFSPFGELPLLGKFSPVAYAMFTGFGPGGGRPGGGLIAPPGGPVGPGGVGGPGGDAVPPVAYAANVPPAGLPPVAVPPADVPPVANFVRPVGNGFPPGLPLAPGSGPGDALGTPGGPGPISIVDGPLPAPGVPEPAVWATLMMGFATIGGMLRRLRRTAARSDRRGVGKA